MQFFKNNCDAIKTHENTLKKIKSIEFKIVKLDADIRKLSWESDKKNLAKQDLTAQLTTLREQYKNEDKDIKMVDKNVVESVSKNVK